MEELQGKTVQFAVKVMEVNERKLPELDEEFYAKFGIEEAGKPHFVRRCATTCSASQRLPKKIDKTAGYGLSSRIA